QFGGDFKGAGSGIRITERAGISRNSDVERIGCSVSQGKVFSPDKLIDDFPRCRCDRIDINQVAVCRVADVVININPGIAMADRAKGATQALPACRIKRNDHVKVLRFARRRGNEVRLFQKAKASRQSLFVPGYHSFAKLLDAERQGKLRADRITIRPDMTENRKLIRRADCSGDFTKRNVHQSSLDLSRSCMISSTRLPRSMESSSLKLRWGVYFKTTLLASSRWSVPRSSSRSARTRVF